MCSDALEARSTKKLYWLLAAIPQSVGYRRLCYHGGKPNTQYLLHEPRRASPRSECHGVSEFPFCAVFGFYVIQRKNHPAQSCRYSNYNNWSNNLFYINQVLYGAKNYFIEECFLHFMDSYHSCLRLFHRLSFRMAFRR